MSMYASLSPSASLGTLRTHAACEPLVRCLAEVGLELLPPLLVQKHCVQIESFLNSSTVPSASFSLQLTDKFDDAPFASATRRAAALTTFRERKGETHSMMRSCMTSRPAILRTPACTWHAFISRLPSLAETPAWSSRRWSICFSWSLVCHPVLNALGDPVRFGCGLGPNTVHCQPLRFHVALFCQEISPDRILPNSSLCQSLARRLPHEPKPPLLPPGMTPSSEAGTGTSWGSATLWLPSLFVPVHRPHVL